MPSSELLDRLDLGCVLVSQRLQCGFQILRRSGDFFRRSSWSGFWNTGLVGLRSHVGHWRGRRRDFALRFWPPDRWWARGARICCFHQSFGPSSTVHPLRTIVWLTGAQKNTETNCLFFLRHDDAENAVQSLKRRCRSGIVEAIEDPTQASLNKSAKIWLGPVSPAPRVETRLHQRISEGPRA